jgi:hypothetical protein
MTGNTKGSPVWIVLARGGQPLRALVSGLTETSGILHVAPNVAVPDRFALHTSFKDRRGRVCRVVSRSPEGIAFEYAAKPPGAEGPGPSQATT